MTLNKLIFLLYTEWNSFFSQRQKLYHLIFAGEVAFISGGNTLTSVELFSPEGNCLHTIAPLPIDMHLHINYYKKNQIYACKGGTTNNCYVYTIANDSWNFFTTGSDSNIPYGIYNEKLYFSPNSGNAAEVLNIVSKVWSTWPALTGSTYGACMVTWKDSFIQFGGTAFLKAVLMFNHTSQLWSTLQASSAPTEMYFNGCVIMPNQQVLIVSDRKILAVYDTSSNSWSYSGPILFICTFSKVFVLGKRVFFFCSGSTNVFEFHYENNTITNTPNALQLSRELSPGVVTVPAKLFSDLPGGCKGVI